MKLGTQVLEEQVVNVGMFFLEFPTFHVYKNSNILVSNSKGVRFEH